VQPHIGTMLPGPNTAHAETEHDELDVLTQTRYVPALMWDASVDLVAQVAVLNGTAYRLHSSLSHMTILGHDPALCNGDSKTLTHLYTADFITTTLPGLIASFEAGTLANGFRVEVPLLHHEGHQVWFESRLSIDPHDARVFLLIFRDITDQRERHRLEVENVRLEVARTKDEEAMDFLAHELKTRFSTCVDLVNGVRETIANVAPRALQAPHNAADCLDDLTGQLQRGIRICMDAAVAKQLMHNVYELRPSSIDLRQEMCSFCGRRLTLHIEDSVPTLLRVDANLLLHVLENFASNAGKYGSGDVHLRVGRSLSRSGPRLSFSMVNPPGLHHAEMRAKYGEDASALFGLGVQGPQADVASNGNGLYLVGKCAAALGGTPTLRFLEEEVRAEFALPLMAEVAAHTAWRLPEDTRIACLDDDSFVRRIDAATFKQLGVQASMRGATLEEIDGFPAFVAGLEPPPRLVLIDYRLDHPTLGTPYVKGTELLPRLRALGFCGKVVIKSANDSTADIARFKAAGADDAVAKGLSAAALGRELARILLGNDTSSIDASILAGYDAPVRREAVALFQKTAPVSMASAIAACEACDAKAMARVLHRLKGAAAYVGATDVVRACNAATSTSCLPPAGHPGPVAEVQQALDVALAELCKLE